MIRHLFRLPRLAVIPASVGAIVAAAALTYPGGLNAAYDDFHDYESHREIVASTPASNAQLDATIVNLTDRIAMKEQWIEELISGRATLNITVQRFLDLNRSNETIYHLIDDQYPGATYEEKAARNVCDFVNMRIRVGPATSTAARDIQNQFRAAYGSNVVIR